MAFFGDLIGPVGYYVAAIFRFWWLWLAPALVTMFIFTWLAWKRVLYKNALEWVLLELRFPREIEKSPKAMEQFLATIHGLRNEPKDFMDKYINGEVTNWFSLEIISLEGEIHFYIRTPAKHRKIVEGNFYANYPMVDMQEAPEYMDKFPLNIQGLYAKGYDIWGAEMQLVKDDAYPLRTYLQFEHLEESMAVDPIAGLLEVLSRVEKGENLCLQFLIRPANSSWRERGEALVKKLKVEGQKTIVGPIGEYTDRPIRTPGETQLLKSIEENISKSGFETLIRYIYVAEASVMNKDFARRSILSFFNQYSVQDMNSFKRNPAPTTDVKWVYFPWIFVNRRAEARKHRIFYNYRHRKMPEESGLSKALSAHILNLNFTQKVFILNTETLATLYHPPTNIVLTGPIIDRMTAKKMGPPQGLPIYEKDKK